MDKVISRTISEIDKVKNENLELSDKLNKARAENERLKSSERDLSKICQGFKKDIETEKSYTLKYYKALQEIREELEEDITCESRECGCDDYEECLNCLKETILTKINEVIGAE